MTKNVSSELGWEEMAAKRDDKTLRHYFRQDYLGSRWQPPILKEEFWQDEQNRVVRYSVAYIDWQTYAGDNGRVLGYDNAHGYHHRHCMGQESEYRFTTYESLIKRFRGEVRKLLKERDAQERIDRR